MPEDENGHDAKDFPSGGVHRFDEVTIPRDRKIIDLYENDPQASTDSVGKAVGVSGIRVSQRLDHWYALGIHMPRWAERRRSKEGEFILQTEKRRKR